MDSHLSIDEVARRTGLTAHTLRYYERIGLLAPVARGPGGQRRYAASDLAWIGFLLRLRETRMPVRQMQVFARLRSQGEATAAERRRMLESHLAEVTASIQAMQRSARALRTKIVHYRAIEASLQAVPTKPERKRHAPRPAPDEHRPLPARTRQTA